MQACVAILEYYKEREKSTVKALKEYKGIESKEKMWIVYKVLRVTNEIKKVVK